MKSGDEEKEKDIRQLAGPEAKVSSGILRSASMSAMTTPHFVQTPSKTSIVTTSSTVNTTDDQWENFADEYDAYDMSLNENDRRKWQATLNVKSRVNSASYLRKKTRRKVETRKRKRISVSLLAQKPKFHRESSEVPQ